MPEFLIKNVPVHFPFEPYDVQRAYMEKVIDCLQTGAHGMLESPTGTGKTLSLLCSSLAWLQLKKAHAQVMRMTTSENGDEFREELEGDLLSGVGSKLGTGGDDKAWGKPKVIYASRTHSQLTQAIAELKRTNYAHMPMAVIGSRDQLCVNEDVCSEQESSVKLSMCQALVKDKKCSYYTNIERKKEHPDFVEAGVMDIEDLIKVSVKHRACPYFMSKEIKQHADIIFMPYNYVLDPRIRKQQDVQLNNSVVILDEGHNVEKICEDSASFSITSTDIAICVSEVTAAMKTFTDDPSMQDFFNSEDSKRDFTPEELMSVKSMFLQLEEAIDSIQLNDNNKTDSTFPGEYIFQLLEKASISNSSYCKFYIIMDRVIQFLNTISGRSPFQVTGSAMDRFIHFLTVVFNFENKTFEEHVKDVQSCYKVYVTLEKPKNNKRRQDSWLAPLNSESKPGGKVVNFWCFNPGFGMKNLLKLGIHSIIVTSGTLSPLPPLISELGIPINVTLENGHVIDRDQVFVSVLSQGPDGVALNSSFKNRQNGDYISSLGRTLVNFSRIVPKGLLVFFPSYSVLNSCKDHWQTSGIWSQISAIKEIYVEPQGKREFNQVMTNYYARIAAPNSKGACFLAVCRGKVSEGLDFADENGRAVVLTGLPFPPYYDPRVTMKRQYLDRNKKKVSGQTWYQLEATRAVNQAVGRVIRHRRDYGAIVFCDARFGDSSLQKQFSAWLRPYVQNSSQFGHVTRGLCQFFKNAKDKIPTSYDKSVVNVWSDKSADSSSNQPVRPSFDTNSDWLCSKPPKSQKGNFIWNSAQTNTSTLSDSYRQNIPTPQESNKNKSMFSALEHPAEVIDFNSLDSQIENISTQSSGYGSTVGDEPDLDPTVFQPKNKRKKICITSTPSYENEICSVNSRPCSSVDVKKNQNLAYMSQVRQNTSSSDYAKFREMVIMYSQKSNFNLLIQNLETIFKDPHQSSLLQAFETFIKLEHKPKFVEYCKRRFNT